jgi:heat shock protein HslJ
MLTSGILLLLTLLSASPLPHPTPKAGGEPAIPPVIWELVELSRDDEVPLAVSEPHRYTVQFRPAGRLAAVADCNRAAGTFTAVVTELEVAIAASTFALCPPDSHGESFLAVLGSANRFDFESDGLLVISGEAGQLQLRASLTGVHWDWQSFHGGDDSFTAPDHPEDYSLTFLPGGKLEIRADCNHVLGTYTADGPIIKLSTGEAPRPKCSSPSLSIQFLRDLDAVSSHVFRDGNLYLALWADAGIMEFTARYDEPTVATPQAG